MDPGSRLNESDLIDIVKSAGPKFSAVLFCPPIEKRVILLSIEGMSCAKNCAAKIQRALLETGGVAQASVDFAMKRARVELEPTSILTGEDLIRVVQSAGSKFQATVHVPNPTIRMKIGGMSCAKNCARKIENALNATPGVTQARVNFPEKYATVELNAKSSVSAFEPKKWTHIQQFKRGHDLTKYSITSVGHAEDFNGGVCYGAYSDFSAHFDLFPIDGTPFADLESTLFSYMKDAWFIKWMSWLGYGS